ncbi:hypothetical protein A2W70_00500 [Candidatus Curtissbacteria bacterium RIFCSPLOWO2_02_41_11]|uniref:Uncharacterized protein n=2 Tax=Candidatus Curtissiibacteriota TaxID=1752717 RepID=A0A1F5HUS8_9BACT|nr:MAG: hypothetical protein UU56_C0001G0037 [Candidatus Curtissbacteria bacterium GW2011_GWA2_41_24]OGD90638.1 MAG: hypothetical protein A2Z54_01595 [Candidatus Curtissbacteria bacterium RIFCSPHIGHO2_02_39_8]OGE07918.1 MAG: hypothetical protein A2W70_00500 [Candidatus Curtissbacteria bacterium RIFCSPLOWO2_02_41_11]
MTSGQETIQSLPTLADLMDGAITRFNSQRLDQSGFNPYYLDRAVIDTMVATGIEDQALFAIVCEGLSIGPELKQLAIDDAKDAPLEHRVFAAAGMLIEQEILSKHPEVKKESDVRMGMAYIARSQ